jgi:hypothetical protein
MPNKYYVILYNADVNAIVKKITFPIKAAQNSFNVPKFRNQFAGGYPALFGGADSDGADKTLIDKVSQQSRGTLKAQAPFEQFFHGEGVNDNMLFYATTNWETAERTWDEPQNCDEAEMSGIATVSLEQFSNKDSYDEMLDKLVLLSESPGGSADQLDQFKYSDTAHAFIWFIRTHLPRLRHSPPPQNV